MSQTLAPSIGSKVRRSTASLEEAAARIRDVSTLPHVVMQILEVVNDPDSSASDLKNAVETAFKVKVDSVRTMVIPGKRKRMGRFEGKRPAWKKAVVRLKPGEVITIFENV